MKFTQATKTRAKKDTPFNPQWAEKIAAKRAELGDSQTAFGRRFDVSAAAVSDWERGVSEAPYRVTWWLYWLEWAELNGK